MTPEEYAIQLVQQNKVKVDWKATDASNNAVYFIVEGRTDIYNPVFRKWDNTWSCECHWASTRYITQPDKWKPCGHIQACQIIFHRIFGESKEVGNYAKGK